MADWDSYDRQVAKRRSRHPAITSNDDCRSCGAHVFWGYCQHYDGCPDGEALAHPSDKARMEGLVSMMARTLGIADHSDPRNVDDSP